MGHHINSKEKLDFICFNWPGMVLSTVIYNFVTTDQQMNGLKSLWIFCIGNAWHHLQLDCLIVIVHWIPIVLLFNLFNDFLHPHDNLYSSWIPTHTPRVYHLNCIDHILNITWLNDAFTTYFWPFSEWRCSVNNFFIEHLYALAILSVIAEIGKSSFGSHSRRVTSIYRLHTQQQNFKSYGMCRNVCISLVVRFEYAICAPGVRISRGSKLTQISKLIKHDRSAVMRSTFTRQYLAVFFLSFEFLLFRFHSFLVSRFLLLSFSIFIFCSFYGAFLALASFLLSFFPHYSLRLCI